MADNKLKPGEIRVPRPAGLAKASMNGHVLAAATAGSAMAAAGSDAAEMDAS
jgi:hypothetical protein